MGKAAENKSLESWIWDAACSIRGVRDAETYRPIAEMVETVTRDSAFLDTAGKLQSVPEGQDKLKVIEMEARETDKALEKILKQLGV